jgi:hypothetical protein
MAVVSARGVGLTSTPYAKTLTATSMYCKGNAFIGAAILLTKHSDSEPTDYVVLHLLCQGIEIALKGLLLLHDYDTYKPRLRPLGHNLFKIATETTSVYRLNPMRDTLAKELRALSDFYSQHLLRYGTMADIFIDPRSIPRDAILRRVGAVIRLAQKAPWAR